MFDSIFGTTSQAYAAQQLFGTGIANTPANLQNQQMSLANAMQQSQLYNRYAQQRTARWMIDGEVCYSVKDFAKRLFPEDEQAQLMLILKFGDV